MSEMGSRRDEIEAPEIPDPHPETPSSLDTVRIDEFADLNEVGENPGDATGFDHVDEVAGTVAAWSETNGSDWEGMNPTQRAMALNRLEISCARDQGRPPAEVRFEDLSAPSDSSNVALAGEFNRETGVLRIDSGLNYGEAVSTTLHEGRHAYQWWAVESASGDPRAGVWEENMNDYCSPDEDLAAYEAQPVEADARAYERAVLNRVEDLT